MEQRRPITAKTRRAAGELGDHVVAWRKLLGLTAEQVAERAGVARSTLHRLESGDGRVNLLTYLDVLRVLGQLDRAIAALDPFETDLGRARADQRLPQRVRR